MRNHSTKIVGLFTAFAFAAAAQASTVTFTLVIDVTDNSFDVFATSSVGDNDGIVSYGIPLTGTVLSIDHKSPQAFDSGTFNGVGFTLFRSGDGVTNLSASQDSFTPTPFIVYGFGQTPGDLNNVTSPLFGAEQQAYGSPVLIAEGTYGATQPGFNLADINLGASTFDDMNGVNPLAASAAAIDTVTLIVPRPFQLMIMPNAATPGSFDFTWTSQPGKVYDLVSSTELSTPPAAWPVWQGNENLSPSGGATTTLTGVPGGATPARFFVVVEKDAPAG